MPKSTFLKLKIEKRTLIENVALKAFALQDYEAVSISRLMQDLALPKGSFYQYFEDKRDLYFHVLEHFQQKKEETLAQKMAKMPVNNSFWGYWAETLYQEWQYHWANPIEWGFWLNAQRERNSTEIGNLQALILQRIAQPFVAHLRQESRQGRVRQDVPIELQAYFLAQTQQNLTHYLLHKYPISLPEVIRGNETLPALPATELQMSIQQWLQLLQSSLELPTST